MRTVSHDCPGMSKLAHVVRRATDLGNVKSLREVGPQIMRGQRVSATAAIKTAAQTTANEVSLFKFKDAEVRVVKIDGEPWFVAADVCRALELGWDRTNKLYAPSRVMGGIAPDERTSKKVARGAPPQIVIAESGLYKLVLRSKVAGAKDFQPLALRTG